MGSSLEGMTVFLDRDGTLNEDTGYIASPEELTLFPGVAKAIARLNHEGARVILITNQSGVARGLLTLSDVDAIHHKLKMDLQTEGGWLDAIYFCPHHPDEGCRCRKPNPGMIEQAQATMEMVLSRSYVLGDKYLDMALAQNIDAMGVLVTTSSYSHEALQAIQAGSLKTAHVAASFPEAVDWVIQDGSGRHCEYPSH